MTTTKRHLNPCACGNKRVTLSDWGAFAAVKCSRCGRSTSRLLTADAAETAWNTLNAAGVVVERPISVVVGGEDLLKWMERQNRDEVVIYQMETTAINGRWRISLRWPQTRQAEL